MSSSSSTRRTAGRGREPAKARPGRLGFLRRPYVALVARLLLGAIFVVSAAGKLLQPDAFVRAVAGYAILPESLLPVVGLTFPWLELLIGVLLLGGLFIRPAAALGGAMLVAFIGLMATAVWQGKAIDCGCFIGIIQETVGPVTLARDTLMLALLPPVFLATSHRLSLDSTLRVRRASALRDLLLAAASLVVVAALGQGIVLAFAKPAPATAPRAEAGWRLGAADAAVEIVVFSDFQCPGCRVMAPVFKRLVDEYGGQVSFVYRHFPLSQHEFAETDAVASEAAGEQGRFWEMHDAIFARSGLLTPTQLRGLAAQLGLDLQRYDDAIASGRARARVQADLAEGKRIGVNGTPYIIVEGEVVPVLSYQAVKAVVDRKLGR